MAQALVVVCDVCRKPAVETVSLKVAARGYQKDVCQTHLDEMIKGARAPRRGRPRTKPAALLRVEADGVGQALVTEADRVQAANGRQADGPQGQLVAYGAPPPPGAGRRGGQRRRPTQDRLQMLGADGMEQVVPVPPLDGQDRDGRLRAGVAGL